MKKLALAVFIIHTCLELAFGANAFISGTFSAQVDEYSAELHMSARNLGSALFALGVLGAVVLAGPGVVSPTGKAVSAGLGTFHGLAFTGAILALLDPTISSYIFPLGAIVIHGSLAAGFITILLRLKLPDQESSPRQDTTNP